MSRVGLVCVSLHGSICTSSAIEQYERGIVGKAQTVFLALSLLDSCSFAATLYCFVCVKVGLLGLGRSLQKDLNRIAETADTSTSQGLHYVLTGNFPHLHGEDKICYSVYI